MNAADWTVHAIPSESLICATCFKIMGKSEFYTEEEIAALDICRVPEHDINGLEQNIIASIDGIEDLFEHYLSAVRDPHERHAKGMVFTPENIVRIMVSDVLSKKPQRLIDCGCGAGRFALRAGDEAQEREVSLEVIAYDADPLACLLTATAATLKSQSVRIVRGDFLEQLIPSSKGATAFIGNPPYIRHHNLSSRQKELGEGLAQEIGLSGWSKLSGLHGLFILKCLSSSKKGDLICFITGSEWLEVNYGKPLREAFSSSLGGGERLVQFSPSATVFEGAQSTALVSYWNPASNRSAISYEYVEDPHKSVRTKPTTFTYDYLHRESKWRLNETKLIAKQPTTNFIELGDLFKISRGIATGNNDFFVLTKEDADQQRLSEFCTPIIARASDVANNKLYIDVNNLSKMLFTPTTDEVEQYESVRGYIALGEAFGIDKGYVTSHRSPWWQIRCTGAPLVATYMGRGRPRFALNPSEVPSLNTVHRLFPKTPLSQCQLSAIAKYLNHGELMGDTGRIYQGGLLKFEPKEMERIKIPELTYLESWYEHDKANIQHTSTLD